MTFVAALKTCYFTKLFNIKDRATRSEFWWWMSFNIVHCIGFFFTSFLIVFDNEFYIAPVMVLLAYVLLSMTTLAIRRLHDLNLSAWWIVPWWAFLIAGPSAADDELAGTGVTICFFILCIVNLFGGTRGTNKYGPDPREVQRQEEQAHKKAVQEAERTEHFGAQEDSTDFMYSKHNPHVPSQQSPAPTPQAQSSEDKTNATPKDDPFATDYMFTRKDNKDSSH